MASYLLFEVKVSNPVAYEHYKSLAQIAIAQYAGRYLVRGGAIEVLEGTWTKPERLVLIEFASSEQAKACYESPEYRAARAARQDAAVANVLLLEGLAL
ncbi:MAG: DUF1330 domain-containing protein [Pseudomonadota bacterium]